MIVPLATTLTLALLAQAPADPDGPVVRLEMMKDAAGSYEIRMADGRARPFRLQAEPVLRFTNTVGATRDGAIFLWLDEGDRPAVAAQVFVKRDGSWTHEFTSLSPGPVVGKTPGAPDWRPTRAGVEFKPVPDAPKPADTPEQRLRQMQELAREFAAEDLFREKSWQPLRLLTRPFARYGKPGGEVLDGALFAYVLTTDPEVYLMLEARAGKDGPEWQFAFAPMTIYSVRASWKGREVWELPTRWQTASHPVEPFYFRENVAAFGRRKP